MVLLMVHRHKWLLKEYYIKGLITKFILNRVSIYPVFLDLPDLSPPPRESSTSPEDSTTVLKIFLLNFTVKCNKYIYPEIYHRIMWENWLTFWKEFSFIPTYLTIIINQQGFVNKWKCTQPFNVSILCAMKPWSMSK